MGIATELTADLTSDIALDWDAALAALAWQLDCGIDEVVSDLPVNRYEAGPPPPIPSFQPQVHPPLQAGAPQARGPAPAELAAPVEGPKPAELAEAAAFRAADLEALRVAMAGFDLCDLKRGARNTVFAEGNPKARVMILGEAPSREDDIAGRPFTGAAGQMLDRMFAAIGLSRSSPDPEAALYLTSIIPWRTPGGREPEAEELEMMLPFIKRHIALADPDFVIVMGNAPLYALTKERAILRARGVWTTAFGKKLLPMAPPDHLLRSPEAKRDAWADLLSLQAHMRMPR